MFLCQISVVGGRGLCYNIDERTSLLWRLLSTKALKGHVDYKKSKGQSLYWILQSVASDWESVLTDYLFVPSNYTSQIRGNKLQFERTDCLIRGNESQSERTDCLIWGNELPIRVNELLIRENGLHTIDIPIYLRLFCCWKSPCPFRAFVKEVLRKFSDIMIESSKIRLTYFWILWYTLLIHFVWLSLIIHLYRFIKCIVHCIWW